MAVLCSECDNPIDVDDELDVGETVECGECGAEFDVVSTEPLELTLVESGGYDDEDPASLPGEEDE